MEEKKVTKISLTTFLIIIAVIAIIIAGIFIFVGNSKLTEKDRRNDALGNLVDVSYIKAQGVTGMGSKTLDTKLATLLNKIDEKSLVERKSQSTSGTGLFIAATGQQPYVFRLYSKDNNLLYMLNYYTGKDEMIIWCYSNTSTDENIELIADYNIDNKDVLNYVKSIVAMLKITK